MEGFYIKKSFDNIFNHVRNHRTFTVILISIVIALSFISIVLFSIISPFLSLPDFSISSFRITNVDKGVVYADFTFNITSPINNEISIKKIDIELYQEKNHERVLLASGNTLKSFIIKRNETIVNISFIFEVPVIENLLEVMLEEEKVSIVGKVYLSIGFSAPFSYKPENIGISILPSIEIVEAHPVPPGSTLEVLARIYNPHDIILNVTSGTFDLLASEYGFLGNVELTEVNIPPESSNLTLFIHMETEEMTWLFETILNNGTLQAEIQNLEVNLLFGGELFDVFMENGPVFTWGTYDPGLNVQGFDNVSFSIVDNILSFDVNLGLLGMPLWGYNISDGEANGSSLSLDFYSEIGGKAQIVGNGTTNNSYSVNRNEMTLLNVHINILPIAAVTMILVWISEGNIKIDVRNGVLNLRFYDVTLQVGFERYIDT
jgi:hypothetical protein